VGDKRLRGLPFVSSAGHIGASHLEGSRHATDANQDGRDRAGE
jgi:hypothetical protein